MCMNLLIIAILPCCCEPLYVLYCIASCFPIFYMRWGISKMYNVVFYLFIMYITILSLLSSSWEGKRVEEARKTGKIYYFCTCLRHYIPTFNLSQITELVESSCPYKCVFWRHWFQSGFRFVSKYFIYGFNGLGTAFEFFGFCCCCLISGFRFSSFK